MTELDAAKLDMAITSTLKHVGIPHHKVHAFIEVMRMLGYEIREVEPAGRGLSDAPPVTELTACESTESPSAEKS